MADTINRSQGPLTRVLIDAVSRKSDDHLALWDENNNVLQAYEQRIRALEAKLLAVKTS